MRIQVLLGPGMWSSALPIVVAHFPVREKPATDPRCERVNFWMGGGGLFLGAHHPVIDPARPLHLVPPAGLAARLCASSSRSSRGAAGPSGAVGGWEDSAQCWNGEKCGRGGVPGLVVTSSVPKAARPSQRPCAPSPLAAIAAGLRHAVTVQAAETTRLPPLQARSRSHVAAKTRAGAPANVATSCVLQEEQGALPAAAVFCPPLLVGGPARKTWSRSLAPLDGGTHRLVPTVLDDEA